jgi:hypothetical protein
MNDNPAGDHALYLSLAQEYGTPLVLWFEQPRYFLVQAGRGDADREEAFSDPEKGNPGRFCTQSNSH